MEGKRLIHKLKLQNLLSFGPEGMEIELEPLNVLIGPNASGKSNLIDAISLLHAAPTDLTKPMRGDSSEWFWKGPGFQGALLRAWVCQPLESCPLRHELILSHDEARARVDHECLVEERGVDEELELYLFDVNNARAVLWTASSADHLRRETSIDTADLNRGESILSQRRDLHQFPELTRLAERYERIAIYREWHAGRQTPSPPPRLPQATDESAVHLEPDARNLNLVLNNLEGTLGPKSPILRGLQRVHPDALRLTFPVFGGTLRMVLHEEVGAISATRLSDGTMRWLCLLAVLCHPDPPPLVCLEEPEMGLHPDAVRILSELLLEASQRMQLIVTTHSSELVSALSGTPEAVVVCKRDAGGTRMERLDPERLEKWLDDYALGDLWAMGEIGGTLR